MLGQPRKPRKESIHQSIKFVARAVFVRTDVENHAQDRKICVERMSAQRANFPDCDAMIFHASSPPKHFKWSQRVQWQYLHESGKSHHASGKNPPLTAVFQLRFASRTLLPA